MADVRNRIEAGLARMARAICRRPWLYVAASVAAVAAMGAGAASLRVDTSNEAFLHESDPILARYLAFKRRFGRDDLILVAIESDRLFGAETLARVKALHDDLRANVPHLADITSLINARNTQAVGDTLHVDNLMADWPRTAAARAALKARVMANPLYLDRLVSRDGRITTVALELEAFASAQRKESDALSGFDDAATAPAASAAPPTLPDDAIHAAVAAVKRILAKRRRPDFQLYMAGTPPVMDALKGTLQSDVRRFLGLAVVAIGVTLWLMFRAAAGVVLPLAVVALSLVATIGTMGHADVPLKVPTAILPSFLLAVGVGASVHLLSTYSRAYREDPDKTGAIARAMGHSGLAIVMTGLTTAAGLGSFAWAEVAPVADVGVFSSLGVLLSLVLTLVLLPALLALWPASRPDAGGAHAHPAFDRAIDRVVAFTTTRPAPVLLFALAVVAACAAGMANLRVSHDVLSWLPDDWPVVRATRKIDRDLRGSVVVEVLVDTRRENGLYDRRVLATLDRLAGDLVAETRDASVFVGKATSVADILKEIHQALNRDDPAFHRIPANPRLIPQEFLLFENSGSDDLQDVVDPSFRTARFTVKVPWRDALQYAPFLAALEKRFAAAFGDTADITTTGVMTIFGRTLSAAIRSAARSYVIALVVVTALMIVLIGSLRIGLLSMVPNLAPIVMTLGLMGWLSLPLDMFTMLIGSIAIGLAVDDTIHFMHNFRRYHAETGDVRDAVSRTLHGAGRAMVVTSVVLCLGFLIFVFASMNNLIRFGYLTGLTIAFAMLADFLVSPALMALAFRGRPPRVPPTDKGATP